MRDGARILITGAASGLGRATALRCADAGAKLTLVDVQADAGTQLASEIGAQFRQCDVSDPDAWERLAADVGVLDHAFLNAGIQAAPPAAPLEDYRMMAVPLEAYRRLLGVNVDGVVFGVRALVPILQPGGSIVATSSLAGLVPYGIDPLYAMTKHAVTGLVRSVAGELAERDLRINAICPGGVDTAIIPEEQRTPEAVFMTPDDLAIEVLRLFDVESSGESWAKVSAERPAHVVHPPGKRRRERSDA